MNPTDGISTSGRSASADEVWSVAGLDAPVTIGIDRWGIPHIRAETMSDLFFAQGFNAARDRLWQLDLARKRGLGLLAADFGPGYLAQDKAARLFLYRGDMDAEWACYGPDAKAICTAFVAGINAFVGETARDPDSLAPEFAITGTTPALWAAEDVVRVRSHSWMRNALSEVVRANVMARTDAETDLLRQNLEPPVRPHVAQGLDLGTIPIAVLDAYKLATAPVSFDPERLRATSTHAAAWSKVDPRGAVYADPGLQGSNNWVVHGSRTMTGRPILANDPHRAHAVPSLRYLVHLTAPGFDAIGAGEPILPGIMMGHNGHSAFGLTLFFGPDEEDIYVCDTKPGEPGAYRTGDGWENVRVVEERVQVKGQPDETLVLTFTRHGPVIFEDPGCNRLYAMRTVWLDPGTAPYAACLISMRSRSFDQFRAAMRHWGAPAVNQVYADIGGDIGWVTAGYGPVRPAGDGLLPVPGEGRYDWTGYLDPDAMPWAHNPEAGFVATANEMNIPGDWTTRAESIGFEWLEPSRAMRLHEVLAGQTRHAVSDSQALQTDTTSLPARRLKVILAGLQTSDETTSRALAMLTGWNDRLDADSAGAALFEVWWSTHLKPALFARLVPDPAVRALVMTPGDVATILHRLEHPDQRGYAEAERNTMMLSTLADAYRALAARFGDASSGWRWGALHHAQFNHALGPLQPPAEAARFNVGPLEKGGGDSTPMMAAYRLPGFEVHLGASVRMVVDVGDWDKSVCINTPGQAGDPRSPYYGNLAPLWARGDYVPMLYSRQAVDEATEKRVVLNPR